MLFNIFSDPLDARSNTIGIYSVLGLSKKLFMNQKTLPKKLEELAVRGIDIEFDYVGEIPRKYNNLSARAVAVAYPEYCAKYWKDLGMTVDEVAASQKKLFGEVIEKIEEARNIHKDNLRQSAAKR